ncbi:MAG: hypothetical protein QOF78_1405 [Phycisphaerales bacterium]|jgi:hypothetical protein|nr:hypothetical protein [Phycisphaerales bacterium]
MIWSQIVGRRAAAVGVAIVTLVMFIDTAPAGVVLVSQDRYTREWGKQVNNIGGAIVSQHDTTIPASGFLPFNDPDGAAKQTSSISISSLSANGFASGFATHGASTSTWSAGDSQYKVVFDIIDEPTGFQLTSTLNTILQNRRSLTGPGGATFQIPTSGTLNDTLAPGRWTLLLGVAASGEGLGIGSYSQTYDMNMTFLPEPASAIALIALAAPLVIRRRRA